MNSDSDSESDSDSDSADLGPLDGLQLDGAVDPEEQVRREVVSVV